MIPIVRRPDLVVLFLPLALVLLAPPVDAAPTNCVPDRRCEKGEEPPSCCQPPPCRVLEYMKQMQAARRLFVGDGPEIALAIAANDHRVAMRHLADLTEAEWSNPKFGSACKTEPGEVPTFRLSRACDLEVAAGGGWRGVAERDDATRDAPGCEEVADAHTRMMLKLRETCDPRKTEHDVREYAVRMRNAIDESIKMMDAELTSYWYLCSTADNPWLKNALSELGIDTDTDLEKLRREAILGGLRKDGSLKGGKP